MTLIQISEQYFFWDNLYFLWDAMYLDNFAPIWGVFCPPAPRTAVNRLQIKSAVSYTRLPFNSVLNLVMAILLSMLSHFIIIIGANPKVALEIEQMIGAEKGCRGDAVLLHFYSPESGNRRQSGECSTEREPTRVPPREPTPRNRPVHPVRPAVRRPFLGDAIGIRLTWTWLKKQL